MLNSGISTVGDTVTDGIEETVGKGITTEIGDIGLNVLVGFVNSFTQVSEETDHAVHVGLP